MKNLRAAYRTNSKRHKSNPRGRTARIEQLEMRHLLASDFGLQTLPQLDSALQAEGEAGAVYSWSLAKDGTPVSVSGKPTASPSNLQSVLNSYYGSKDKWFPVFQAAVNAWDEVTGVSFVYETADDGAPLPESPGQAGIRGRLRFAGTEIDNAGGILAEANSGEDVVLDSGFGRGEAFLRQLYIVLVHEIGHVLGLDHAIVKRPELPDPVKSNLPLGVMQPTLESLDNADLEFNDILEAQKLHGDNYEPNNSFVQARDLGNLLPGVNTFDKLSLFNDDDVFRVNATQGQALSIRAIPDRDSFLRGRDEESLVRYDALQHRRLTVEIRSADGTFQTTSSAPLIGNTAVIKDFAIRQSGPYFVRVTGDNSQEFQAYSLVIDVGVAPEFDPATITADIQGLRNQIEAANTSKIPVTINLERGTYKFDRPIEITGNITLIGQGSEATILDGQNVSRIFVLEQFSTFNISGATLTRGTATSGQTGGAIFGSEADLSMSEVVLTDNRGGLRGGAIYIGGGRLKLDKVTASFNQAWTDPSNNGASEGGALFVSHTQATITNSRFSDNTASFGGAIGVESNLTIKDSQIVNNRGGANANGGGINVREPGVTLTADNCWISGNTAYDGAGINIEQGTAILNSLKIENNEATRGGGGIMVYPTGRLELSNSLVAKNTAVIGGGIELDGKDEVSVIRNSWIRSNTASFSGGGVWLTGHSVIEMSTISENTAEHGYGGGIALLGITSTLLVVNSTVSLNRASNQGGGIAVGESTLEIIYSTIAGNKFIAQDAGGGAGLDVIATGKASITNSIIAQNGEGGLATDAIGRLSVSASLLGAVDRETFEQHNNNGNILGLVGAEVNAGLEVLADHGSGLTPTHRLLPDSPAVDAAMAIEGLATSQNGITRRLPDMGAFELFKVENTSSLPPTINALTNPAPVDHRAGQQSIDLTNVFDANDPSAPLSVTATSSNSAIVRSLQISSIAGGRATLRYTPVVGASGEATIQVQVRAQGPDRKFGSADDTFTQRSFVVRVNGPTSGAPVLALDNAFILEPRETNENLSFRIYLSAPSTQAVQVRLRTRSVSAEAGSDFTATNSLITLQPGQQTATFEVPILVDSVLEQTEVFDVDITEVIGASLANLSASGFIYDSPIVIGSPILAPARRQPQDVPVIFVIITPSVPGAPAPKIVRIQTPVKAERLLASAFALADTNRDKSTSAIDALLVINALNTLAPSLSGNITANFRTSIASLDVNRDGFVTALDALLVINELNTKSSA